MYIILYLFFPATRHAAALRLNTVSVRCFRRLVQHTLTRWSTLLLIAGVISAIVSANAAVSLYLCWAALLAPVTTNRHGLLKRVACRAAIGVATAFLSLWICVGLVTPSLSFHDLSLLLGSLLFASGTVSVGIAFRILSARRARRPPVTNGAVPCGHCGYRIDNIPSQRCPECGNLIHRTRTAHEVSADANKRTRGHFAALAGFCGCIWLMVGITLIILCSTTFRTLGFGICTLEYVLFESPGARTMRSFSLADRLETKLINGGIVTQQQVRGIFGSPDCEQAQGTWTTTWLYEFSLEPPRLSRGVILLDFVDENLLLVSWDTADAVECGGRETPGDPDVKNKSSGAT